MFGASEPTSCRPVVPDSEHPLVKPCPSLGWPGHTTAVQQTSSPPELLDEVAHLWSNFPLWFQGMARCWSAADKDQGSLRLLVPHFWQFSEDFLLLDMESRHSWALEQLRDRLVQHPVHGSALPLSSAVYHMISLPWCLHLFRNSRSNSVLQTRGSCCPASAFWVMSCQQSEAQSNSKYPKKTLSALSQLLSSYAGLCGRL